MTAIERVAGDTFFRDTDRVAGWLEAGTGGLLDLTFADLRLAADCIAFVRDFNQLIERGTRGPLTPGANEAMDVRHKALAARIKEREE